MYWLKINWKDPILYNETLHEEVHSVALPGNLSHIILLINSCAIFNQHDVTCYGVINSMFFAIKCLPSC